MENRNQLVDLYSPTIPFLQFLRIVHPSPWKNSASASPALIPRIHFKRQAVGLSAGLLGTSWDDWTKQAQRACTNCTKSCSAKPHKCTEVKTVWAQGISGLLCFSLFCIYIYCYNHHVISCYIMLYHVRSCYIMLYLGCLPAVPIKSHWERDILTSRSPLPVLWDSPSSPNELKLAEPGHRSFLGKAAVQRQTGNERLLGLA
jgi:hypothetical protein